MLLINFIIYKMICQKRLPAVSYHLVRCKRQEEQLMGRYSTVTVKHHGSCEQCTLRQQTKERRAMNTDRTYTKTAIRLLIALILCLPLIAPALASAEVLTYDYDNAEQVKTIIYSNGSAMARIRLCL